MPEDKRRKNKQQRWNRDCSKKTRTRRGNEDENEDEDDIINKLTSAIQRPRTKQHIQTFFGNFLTKTNVEICICVSVSICLCMVAGPSLIVNQKLWGLLNTQFWVSAYIVCG